MERTFVMVKPDGVQRGLVGEVIRRLERKGLKLVGLKMMQIDRKLAEKHYEQHKEKQFFPGLVEFITSGPVVAMVWEGIKAIDIIRNLMGATNSAQAVPGSIRGDFAVDIGNNIVHGSDSPEAASREIGLFFRDSELINYERTIERWIYQE